jgi:diketogulonate reductase-like aldo/keto reductase
MMTHKLNTGAEIPAIGFGTWKITPDDNAKAMVLKALEAGYRLIDTAHIYRNEKGVGEAIRESGIPREEVFVTTKLWNEDQGYDRTLRACQTSLEQLGLDYLDLYLIHWPATSKRHESWQAFEELYQQGTIKAAGVSNYTIEHLQGLMKRSELVPAINQVEFHPFIYGDQAELLKYCNDQGIRLEAYSPLSRLNNTNHQEITRAASAHHISEQQIILRWCIQHGTIPLPRSSSRDHIVSNFDVFGFELTKDEMKQLNHLSDGERVIWDPAGMG